MALDYERGDLLFEDDFTGDLSAWNIYAYDGIQSVGNSYADVYLNNNQLVLYTQHDGESGASRDSRPCDSIAAVETTESWQKSSFTEVQLSYTYNPTWTNVVDISKAPYIPGIEWGDLGSNPYRKDSEDSRNKPMRNGWANRYGERTWGGDLADNPQVANDRYDAYDINTAKNNVTKLPESDTHLAEAVAVDEEAQLRLERAGGTVNEVSNRLADVIGASGHAFVEDENLGIAADQSIMFDEGDEVALGVGGDFAFIEGNEIATSESVSVSDQNNHLVLENRIVNNFDDPHPDNEAWIEIRVDYVKVWEAVVK